MQLADSKTTASLKLPIRPECPELCPKKQDWLNLLHLIATHRPAHLQHDYTTIQLQVGDVMPVRSFPAMWETATMMMLGRYKQGEVWMEDSEGISCPVVCRNDKYQTSDGYLLPAKNQFIALNKNAKYSILPAKGERIVVTYILMKPDHIASYQHVLVTKKSLPAQAFAYPVRKRLTKKGPDPYEDDVDMKGLWTCAEETLDAKPPVPYRPPELWEQHERDGHMPKLPDCPICVQEHVFVVRHFSSTSNSLHTLHLDAGYWGDLSLDGKRYFVVAGLRVQHDDNVMLVPFFIPVENKTGLVVSDISQEVFQLIDNIATCKQLQAFHGSKVLRI